MEDPKEYVKINEMTRRDAKEVLEKIPIKWKKVDARVLDIGCGDGGVTSNILKKYMPENFKKLVGCDKNIECVKYAQEHYGNEKVHFMALDVEEKIPDELKETFDHIFSSYAFNWIRKQEIAFTNVYDMLTEGGNCQLLFVGHSNAFQVFDDLSRTPKWRSHLENVHTKFTSPYFHSQDPAGEIQTMMKRIGFKDIDVRATRETYAYEDGVEMFKSVMKCLNPFQSLEENWEEFMSDALALDPDLGIVKYVLIVACGSK
ncbi:juvenile hormone acid O-methyltransferase-like [Choristoneura fumiferana]|uniref:juvenile hormone acid O-methyltransferase-like n=1 Tax=Choristoneura fumiferana TaxID=7141 RepID=UPI003D15846F